MIEKLRQKLAPLPLAGFNVASVGADSLLDDAGEPEHPHPWLLWTLVGIMVVLWSINLPIGKLALQSFPPLLLISIRTVIAGLLMLPVYFVMARDSPPFERADWPGLAAVCLFGQVGNQVLFVSGLSRTSVGHSSFILAASPILILLMAVALKMERLTRPKLIGMAVSAAGVIWLSQEKGAAGGPTVIGDLFMLAGGTAFAVFTVGGKVYRNRYGAIALNMLAYSLGSAALLPVVVASGWNFSFSEVPLQGWLCLAYMAVFPAVVCYVIYSYALGYLTASRIASLGYFQPPLATGVGVFLLAEPISPILWAAGAVILAGVFLAERR